MGSVSEDDMGEWASRRWAIGVRMDSDADAESERRGGSVKRRELRDARLERREPRNAMTLRRAIRSDRRSARLRAG